jgi:hypothetical protein
LAIGDDGKHLQRRSREPLWLTIPAQSAHIGGQRGLGGQLDQLAMPLDD